MVLLEMCDFFVVKYAAWQIAKFACFMTSQSQLVFLVKGK